MWSYNRRKKWCARNWHPIHTKMFGSHFPSKFQILKYYRSPSAWTNCRSTVTTTINPQWSSMCPSSNSTHQSCVGSTCTTTVSSYWKRFNARINLKSWNTWCPCSVEGLFGVSTITTLSFCFNVKTRSLYRKRPSSHSSGWVHLIDAT